MLLLPVIGLGHCWIGVYLVEVELVSLSETIEGLYLGFLIDGDIGVVNVPATGRLGLGSMLHVPQGVGVKLKKLFCFFFYIASGNLAHFFFKQLSLLFFLFLFTLAINILSGDKFNIDILESIFFPYWVLTNRVLHTHSLNPLTIFLVDG
jgi:hypothetical protein